MNSTFEIRLDGIKSHLEQDGNRLRYTTELHNLTNDIATHLNNSPHKDMQLLQLSNHITETIHRGL